MNKRVFNPSPVEANSPRRADFEVTILKTWLTLPIDVEVIRRNQLWCYIINNDEKNDAQI